MESQSKVSIVAAWLLVAGAAQCHLNRAQTQDAVAADSASNSLTLDELRVARLQARFRQRRLIINNDGNDKTSPPYTPERFLASRTTGLEKTQVDSLFYCTGIPMLYTHRSKIAEQMGVGNHTDVPNKTWVAAFNALNTDSLEIMVDWCKRHDREVFWSMRINDRHDSGTRWSYLITDWKRNHPELLMGTQEGGLPESFKRGARSWSLLRYDMPEVREKVFQIIEEICNNYDVDGIELDFWRHPACFVEPLMDKSVPQHKMDELTELWQRVRHMTEQVGMKRGRPILIAIRIPDSMDYCRAMGLDVPRWLGEDLVDLVVAADYFKLEPWENLVATGKKYNVPVYGCFEIRRLESTGKETEKKRADIRVWRGEAYNAWKAGLDGIYLMNRFDPHAPMLHELGDPEILASKERIDQTAYFNPKVWCKPTTWVPDGMKYLKQPKQKSVTQP
ncbi:MAG: hypothetical protein KDA57_01725 [Planctomycetales bacterium]|nr:hypothetical protein [Planctomycetales bacterium]